MRLLASVAVAGLVVALAGCSGGTSSPVCTTVPIPNTVIPEQVYPVPGYAKVPDDAPAMVVAYDAAPELAETITIKADGGSPVSLGAFGAAPKPMPTPFVQHPQNNGAFYGVTMPKLQAHTHYTVAYRFATQAGLCNQTNYTSQYMGSFTTL